MLDDFSEKLQLISDELLDARKTLGESVVAEKSVSKSQAKTMTAACKSKKFRKKIGIPKDVACEFHKKDKGTFHEAAMPEWDDVPTDKNGVPLPQVKPTKSGWQVYVHGPRGWIPQGEPHRAKIDAELDAESFITESVFEKAGPTSGHECQCTGCGNFYDDTLMQCPNCNAANVEADNAMELQRADDFMGDNQMEEGKTWDAVKDSAKKYWHGTDDENQEGIRYNEGDYVVNTTSGEKGKVLNVLPAGTHKGLRRNETVYEVRWFSGPVDRVYAQLIKPLDETIEEDGLPASYDAWRTSPPDEDDADYGPLLDTLVDELVSTLENMDLTGYTYEDDERVIDDAIADLKIHLPDELEDGFWFADQYDDLYIEGKRIFDKRIPPKTPVDHRFESKEESEDIITESQLRRLSRLAGIKT